MSNSPFGAHGYMLPHMHIRESVDSVGRDGPDTPISYNKCYSSELINTAAKSPCRHIEWPTSVSIHNTT